MAGTRRRTDRWRRRYRSLSRARTLSLQTPNVSDRGLAWLSVCGSGAQRMKRRSADEEEREGQRGVDVLLSGRIKGRGESRWKSLHIDRQGSSSSQADTEPRVHSTRKPRRALP
ncbi:hypothetical protein WMY93_006613 [Mugilogobius chulae]|uniref:Uncharacterized protein n=1 Tax=Mugilogobius chulae TaxID=88201 RepID=A0AAW0PK93_9GOBI